MRNHAQERAKRRLGLVAIRATTGRALIRMLDDGDAGGITPQMKFRLQARGIIKQSDGSLVLTDVGRWQAIARKMKLCPVEMFIASDMYVEYDLRRRQRQRDSSFPYAFQPMAERLTGLLDVKTVQNKIWRLKRRGIIKRMAPRLYALTEGGAGRLREYHYDVYAMRNYVRAQLL